MIIQYTLTMPHKGSWDGKWTGEGELYARCRHYDKTIADKILGGKESGSWRYRWTDGWVACIEASIVDTKKAAFIRKHSRGFYGYDWMIDSIEQNGKITA